MTEPTATARILIVEDSTGVARTLSLGLGHYHNGAYRTEICTSGEAALKRLVEVPFDLLISDLRMQGIDGLTLLERARHLSPSTRTILITAFGSPEVEQRARRMSAAYLAKPFMIQDVLRLVDEVLGAPAADVVGMSVEPASAIAEPKPETRKAVHLTVFACDLDGTLTQAQDGQIAASTWAMLRAAKAAGIALFLVTGRTLDSFLSMGPFDELFDAIIAENGAVIHFPRRDSVLLPFGPLAPVLVQRLHKLQIPLESGIAIVATVVPYDEIMLQTLRESRASATVEYNGNAAMLLPTGASKGSGLLYALDELGYSAHNTVACGNAGNDRSLFEVTELGVAVANADSGLCTIADAIADQPAAQAVEALLQDLIEGKTPERRPRLDRLLMLGYRTSGSPVRVDPFALIEANVGIVGSSGSGKSWLAGLLAEELLKQKYQVCIIDPEGDYRALGAAPRTLLLGGPEAPLPPISDITNLVEWNNVSMVLDLSSYENEQRLAYVDDFLRVLRGVRARRGRPHYFLLDEVQSFCPADGGALTDLVLDAMDWGGFALVSYRPSLVAKALLDRLDHFLVTRLMAEEELDVLRPWLAEAEAQAVLGQLPELPKGQAFLLMGQSRHQLAEGPMAVRFEVGSRIVPHVRHVHKYLRAPLPGRKRFYFSTPEGHTVGSAANLWEFCEQLGQIPISSLQYHLERKDFVHWLVDVLHDEELARRVNKVAHRNLSGAVLRDALLEVVAERYKELEVRH